MGRRLAKKVLLIGWDAADWQMINPLLEQGKMPALAKLMEGGVSGNLATIQPILSPMLWTSIATGKRADKHGICGFVEPLPDGTGIRPVTSTSRTCKAVWNILNQSGLRSNVVNWFASYPAEPINGTMVANLYSDARRSKEGKLKLPKDAIHPQELYDELVELHVRGREITPDDIRPLIPLVDDIDVQEDTKPLELAILLASAASTQAATTHLMETTEWDFTAVYFPAVDHFGHHFMEFHPPRQPHVSDQNFERYRHVMNGCYMFHDMLLQGLLRQAGEETTVMIVSDHGFHSGEVRPDPKMAKDNPEIEHRHLGIACLHGPGIQKDVGKLFGATLLDVTPTILSLFGLPVGLDMDGRPWLEVLENPDPGESPLSWESIKGNSGQLPPEAVPTDIEGADEAIQQLVDLGYIEPLSEDLQKNIQGTKLDLKKNRIRALFDSQRFAEAVPLLEQLIIEERENEWLKLMLATCHYRRGEIEGAECLVNQLSDTSQENPTALGLKSKIAFAKEKPDEGLKYLEKAVALSPSSVRLLCDLASAHFKLGRFEDAELIYTRCLKIDPDYPFAHHGRTLVELQKKDFEQAVVHALEAIGIMPYFPEAHFLLGIALTNLKNTAEAITAFESCENMQYKLPTVYQLLENLHRGTNPGKASHYKELWRRTKAQGDYFLPKGD
jgi:predicted AlkP superfamily phosphohydrolase/phosphomutase/tetratricopeptide (TPR) repeat protein